MYTVIGKKSGTFTNDNGELITYGKLYCTTEFTQSENAKTDGLECVIISLKPAELAEIPVGAEIDVYYNRYGRVSSVEIVGGVI